MQKNISKIQLIIAAIVFVVALKVYVDDPLLQSSCEEMMQEAPQELMEQLRYIKVIPRLRQGGLYNYYGQGIILKDCDRDYFMHELAHHRAKMLGDTLHQSVTHTGRFKEIYEVLHEK